MALLSEQFQQSDVTVWGIAALVAAGIAVVGANVAGLVPTSALMALHSPKNEAISMAQLRQQVLELRTETAQLRRQNEVLNTRFSLQEQTGNEVIRRVGALEVSMPTLAELRPSNATPVDRTVTTASIGVNAAQQFDADGGTVVVRQSPMLQQPLPAPIETASAASGAQVGYAVTVGASFLRGEGAAQWHDLKVRLGSMVIDMTPLLTDAASASQQRIVLGPIAELADARDLCQRLEQMEVACSPTSYVGTALSQ